MITSLRFLPLLLLLGAGLVTHIAVYTHPVEAIIFKDPFKGQPKNPPKPIKMKDKPKPKPKPAENALISKAEPGSESAGEAPKQTPFCPSPTKPR
jgi:hypothetical protein